jgi:hypothetical protein
MSVLPIIVQGDRQECLTCPIVLRAKISNIRPRDKGFLQGKESIEFLIEGRPVTTP